MVGIPFKSYNNYARVPTGMKVSRGRIVETTVKALFDYFTIIGYDDIMNWDKFKKMFQRAGVHIKLQ